jgi:hypothetical protein
MKCNGKRPAAKNNDHSHPEPGELPSGCSCCATFEMVPGRRRYNSRLSPGGASANDCVSEILSRTVAVAVRRV